MDESTLISYNSELSKLFNNYHLLDENDLKIFIDHILQLNIHSWPMDLFKDLFIFYLRVDVKLNSVKLREKIFLYTENCKLFQLDFSEKEINHIKQYIKNLENIKYNFYGLNTTRFRIMEKLYYIKEVSQDIEALFCTYLKQTDNYSAYDAARCLRSFISVAANRNNKIGLKLLATASSIGSEYLKNELLHCLPNVTPKLKLFL